MNRRDFITRTLAALAAAGVIDSVITNAVANMGDAPLPFAVNGDLQKFRIDFQDGTAWEFMGRITGLIEATVDGEPCFSMTMQTEDEPIEVKSQNARILGSQLHAPDGIIDLKDITPSDLHHTDSGFLRMGDLTITGTFNKN